MGKEQKWKKKKKVKNYLTILHQLIFQVILTTDFSQNWKEIPNHKIFQFHTFNYFNTDS
jgi:hypothetical protein